MPTDESGPRQFNRFRKWPRPFTLALVLSVVVAGVGTYVALTATYYESTASLEFTALAPDPWTFVLHFRADGPMSVYKEVTVKGAQVLGYPLSDVARISLLLRSDQALWTLNITRNVAFKAGSPVNEFWTGTPSDGRLVFTQPGIMNVTAIVWVTPGQIEPATGNDLMILNVLSKDADESWIAGRFAIVSLVIGVAIFAIPTAVREFRDLYRGT